MKMKNLKEILENKFSQNTILEKLIINKSSKIKREIKYQEITPEEFQNQLAFTDLGKKICRIFMISHRFIENNSIYREFYPKWKNQAKLGYTPHGTTKNWYIELTYKLEEDNHPALDLINYDFDGFDKVPKRIIFNFNASNWDAGTQYVPIGIQENPDNKDEVIIYIATTQEIQFIQQKLNSKNNTSNNIQSDFFEFNNEANLLKQIDSKYQADKIPQNEKYAGKTNLKSKLFWKVWSTLAIFGDMSKGAVLEKINNITGSNLVLSSYGTIFTEWNKNNRIEKTKGILSAIPYNQWNK